MQKVTFVLDTRAGRLCTFSQVVTGYGLHSSVRGDRGWSPPLGKPSRFRCNLRVVRGTHNVVKSAKSAKAPKAEKVFGANGVSYTFPQGEGGPIQIRIDFAQVPEPAGYYYADAFLLNSDTSLQMSVLTFGRRDAASNEFGDRIEVVMPTKSLAPFLSSSQEVEKAVDKIIASLGTTSQPRPITLAKAFVPAPTLYANAIFVAVGDGESVFDFYHLSPRQTHFAKSQKLAMQIQPIVRVVLSSVLTKYFFEVLRPFVQNEGGSQSTVGGTRRAVRSY